MGCQALALEVVESQSLVFKSCLAVAQSDMVQWWTWSCWTNSDKVQAGNNFCFYKMERVKWISEAFMNVLNISQVSGRIMLSVFLSFTSDVNMHVCEIIVVGSTHQLQVLTSEP